MNINTHNIYTRKGPRHHVEVLFIILNVLAVSINVACNSENQCFDVAKVLQNLI